MIDVKDNSTEILASFEIKKIAISGPEVQITISDSTNCDLLAIEDTEIILCNKDAPVLNLTERFRCIDPEIQRSYTWNDGYSNQNFNPDTSGLYILETKDDVCVDRDSIFFIRDNPSIAFSGDSTFCYDQQKPAELHVSSNTNEFSINGLSLSDSIIRVSQEGIYEAVAITEHGCTDTASIAIQEICEGKVFAPTAFTPNGDGKNDLFGVQTMFVDQMQLEIFNRNGKSVFQSNQTNPSWDGKIKGSLAQQGIYSWKMRYRTEQGEVKQELGVVSLIR